MWERSVEMSQICLEMTYLTNEKCGKFRGNKPIYLGNGLDTLGTA